MKLRGLNSIERLALWVLCRSPRIGLLIVKRHGEDAAAFSVSPDDVEDVKFAYTPVDHDEPASMLLERLYHAPSYGEIE